MRQTADAWCASVTLKERAVAKRATVGNNPPPSVLFLHLIRAVRYEVLPIAT